MQPIYTATVCAAVTFNISLFFLLCFVLHLLCKMPPTISCQACHLCPRSHQSLSYNRKHNSTDMKWIPFYLWQDFLWIYHRIRAGEIIYSIYLWWPVGVAVTLHVHASWGGGGGDGGAMAWYWVRRCGMGDWVKWTATTIWFSFTWSSCFPYFPFVCSRGSSPVWEEWCDAA